MLDGIPNSILGTQLKYCSLFRRSPYLRIVLNDKERMILTRKEYKEIKFASYLYEQHFIEGESSRILTEYHDHERETKKLTRNVYVSRFR